MANVNEDRVGFIKEAKSEGSETDLDNGSVVLDHNGNWLLEDSMCHLALLDEVLCLVVSVVDGMMITLLECGLDLILGLADTDGVVD